MLSVCVPVSAATDMSVQHFESVCGQGYEDIAIQMVTVLPLLVVVVVTCPQALAQARHEERRVAIIVTLVDISHKALLMTPLRAAQPRYGNNEGHMEVVDFLKEAGATL